MLILCRCIPYDQKCNGETNCPDGSDELDCNDSLDDAFCQDNKFKCENNGMCILK